ncbi:MAG: LPS assembly lipoprotein LptE [Odoribacteraceae bacterium]|nr:LPS assembly lipoprotein LptE [Odoribacteraceae bacterium]
MALLLCIAGSVAGCKLEKISYDFKGVTLDASVKTFSVDFFANKTPFAPNLGPDFTEALKAYLRSRTSLNEVTDNNGDIRFSGQITGFSQRPMEIQRDEVAANNRLTVTIQVKFVNTKSDKETDSFDSSFSHYEDFGVDQDYNSIEADLLKKITDKVIEDVFNKALVNW